MCWKSNKDRDAYLSLTENITLNRIMRQRGENENARRFRELLEDFRNNEVSDEDVELLNNRVLQRFASTRKSYIR